MILISLVLALEFYLSLCLFNVTAGKQLCSFPFHICCVTILLVLLLNLQIQVDQDASWGKNMRDVKVTHPVALDKQSWLCIYPKSAQDGLNMFMNDLLSVGRSIGMNIGDPAM